LEGRSETMSRRSRTLSWLQNMGQRSKKERYNAFFQEQCNH